MPFKKMFHEKILVCFDGSEYLKKASEVEGNLEKAQQILKEKGVKENTIILKGLQAEK